MNEQDKAACIVIEGFNPAELFGKGFNLGCADLIQGGSLREVVGRTVSSLLLNAVDMNGRRVFKGATIVLPPATVTKHTVESVFTAVARAIKELRGTELDEQEEPILRRLVCVVNSPSLEVGDVLRIMHEQGARRLVAVADASQYQDSSFDLRAAFGVSAVRIDEDRWAPHVASMCRQIVPIMKELEGYGLVHVSEVPAQKPANVERLLSVDDCYVTTLHYEADPEEVFIPTYGGEGEPREQAIL